MAARGERRRSANIVRYWRAVEMFSPQKVGDVSPDKRMFRVDGGHPLPWEQGHQVRSERLDRSLAWQHTVYCGCRCG